jgi:hypothetical protein
MPLQRQKHWATRAYHQFLVDRAQAPFAWGVNDCATFAADGIKAITGIDIAEDFRGKYEDEASAMAAIRNICALPEGLKPTAADAAAYCARKHGLKEWPRALCAQRGDLVIFRAPTGALVAGLVHLSGQIVAVGEKGLYLFPISKALRAWHYD